MVSSLHSPVDGLSMSGLVHRVSAELHPDPARVVARLFLPGEELISGRSRVGTLLDRVMALPEEDLQHRVELLIAQFSTRHRRYTDLLLEHASIVRASLPAGTQLSPARLLLLGATFTSEYAVEAAALCNPSAVLHPDQSGLADGQIRVVLSVRGIGEGHLSSIGFAAAVIGPGPQWVFEPRQLPSVVAKVGPGRIRRSQLRARMVDLGPLDGLARGVLGALPEEFTATDVERGILGIDPSLLVRAESTRTVEALRRLAAASAQLQFPDDVDLSQQVLMPSSPQESHGVEDARFVLFAADDGTSEYRGTYTAYDGQRIEPRLIVSSDLRTFRTQGLAGPAAHNKGMALFPRKIDGRHYCLCRSDGESTGISTSSDGVRWNPPTTIEVPAGFWALLQVGNCGSPLETEHGWLVLTHGVGPMRVYSVGAVLLDLDDPTRMVKRLDEPLLHTTSATQNGYVPNVVYSCGGLIHDGRLWVPYGIGDSRIAVAWVDVDDLVGRMTDVDNRAASDSAGQRAISA